MKTSLSLIVTFCLSIIAHSALAEESSGPVYPYYVRVTQEYHYPGTELVSTAGMIEQVIGESLGDLVLSTPIGTTVSIPKSLTVPVSEREAAAGLIAERVIYTTQMKQAGDYIQQILTANKQFQAEREQIEQALQMAISAQQQQNSGGSSAQDQRDESKAIRAIEDLMKNLNK